MSEIAKPAERQEMIARISDARVVEYLEAGRRGDPNARQQLADYLRTRFESLKESTLVPPSAIPGQPGPEHEVLTFRASNDWNDLVKDILIAADRLWRDNFLDDKSDSDARERLHGKRGSQESQDAAQAEQVDLELLCQYAHRLLQLWLEASLYRVRSLSNFQSWGVAVPGRGENTVQGEYARIVAGYLRPLKEWARELRPVTGLRLFGIRRRDAQLLKALSKEFGRAQDQETGWKTLASDARSALRFQASNTRLRERWQHRHYLSALAYFLYKITTGYGTKPKYFARTGLFTIAAFMVGFWANDFFNPGILSTQRFCPASNMAGAQWYEIFWHYLYLSVVTLTSLGPDGKVAEYCGGTFTQVLLIAAAFAGYFLLATLAALLVNQLTDAD